MPHIENYEVIEMVILSDDEVVLIKSILISIRSIKTRKIDKAIAILSKRQDRR